MKKEVKLNFRITNSNNLITFLKKLKMVDRSVILEMEGQDFFAKVRTPDKSVIKYVGSKLDNFFEGDSNESRVKIGIMEIGKGYLESVEYLWAGIPLEDQALLYRPEFGWVVGDERRKIDALRAYQGFKGML